jgi:hypothetical protein
METGSDPGYQNSDRNFTYAQLNHPLTRTSPCEDWSLTTLKEKLIKIGAKVVSHGRYVAFQMAEVAIPRNLFAEILRLIAELRPPPAASKRRLRVTRFEPNPREDCVQMTGKSVGMRRQTRLRRPKAANNHPRPACGRQSSRRQEPSVPVGRSSGGFRVLGRPSGRGGSDARGAR